MTTALAAHELRRGFYHVRRRSLGSTVSSQPNRRLRRSESNNGVKILHTFILINRNLCTVIHNRDAESRDIGHLLQKKRAAVNHGPRGTAHAARVRVLPVGQPT